MLQVTTMAGDMKLKWMRWAKAMLGWRAIGAEARVTWPKSAARQRAWWKVGKENARITLEKVRPQWVHGKLKEEMGKGKRVVGKAIQMLVAKAPEEGKGTKELAGRAARLVTRLTKENVAAAKERRAKKQRKDTGKGKGKS